MIESALFQSRLADCHLKTGASDPLFRLRQQAWDRFLEKGLPDKKSEVYQYVKLRKLFARELTQGQKRELDPSKLSLEGERLLFINGFFCPEMSVIPKEVEILPLSEAIFSFGTFLNNQWAKMVKEEKDPFALLNSALFTEGALIYLPPKKRLPNPLQLYFITTDAPIFSMPRLEVFLGGAAEAHFVTHHIALSGGGFVNAFTNLHLEEGAKATLTQAALDLPDLWVFDALRAHLKREATLTTHMATTGTETARFDYQVELAGERAQAHLNGLWMLKENREAHVHVLMKHSAPFCPSLQHFKGVLNDSSRSSFEGKIFVHKEAQKTDSFQMNNNLLLSDHAQAYSKPNLEIFADDVKASHGATFGQLDAEELFYLKARGLNEREAKGFLTRAFLQEVLYKMEASSLRSQLMQHAEAYLG